MNKILTLITLLTLSCTAGADVITALFDNNASPRGFLLNGTTPGDVTWTGAYVGTEDDFNNLDGVTGTVNFSVNFGSGFVLAGFMDNVNGDYSVGATGIGIGGDAGIDAPNEAVQFTFTSHDIVLTDINYTGPDANGQTVLVEGTPVSGSPFSSDVSGQSFNIPKSQTITFGAANSADYILVDFTFDTVAVPEPSTLAMFLIALGGLGFYRRSMRG